MSARLALSLTMALTGAALLAAVAAGGSEATEPRVLRLNISDTSIEYIDPALNYDCLGWRLSTKSGAAGAKLIPEVARSMPSVSPNGLTYTFSIRPGYRFSDGTTVTARSFRRAIERALSPKMQSPGASFSSDIVGASAVIAGKASTPSAITSGSSVKTFITGLASRK